MRRKTTQETIADFREVHGDRYDYSKVDYMGARTKVTIGCPKHGDFEQTPDRHKNGQGCRRCYGLGGKTTSETIADFRRVHGDRYDYSRVEYVKSKTKVTIGCDIHGDFKQTPASHRSGNGCPKCGGGVKRTTQEAIADFQKVHGDRYDYSRVKYAGNNAKVTIICYIHGDFDQLPSHHKRGSGCPGCVGNKKKTATGVIADFRGVHGDRYDYSKVEYVNNSTKVTIGCEIHGGFEQTPANHQTGVGCPNCAEYGYNPAKPAIMYLVLVNHKRTGVTSVKIGITGMTVARRYANDERYNLIDTLWESPRMPGHIVERSESAVIDYIKRRQIAAEGSQEMVKPGACLDSLIDAIQLTEAGRTITHECLPTVTVEAKQLDLPVWDFT